MAYFCYLIYSDDAIVQGVFGVNFLQGNSPNRFFQGC